MGYPVFAGDGAMDETRTLAFRAINGTYPFPESGGEVVFMPDAEGLDMPPRDIIRQPLPGLDGTQLREIRTLEREVFVPIWLASWSSHLQYLNRRDALAALFRYHDVDYVSESGTFDLEAASIRGVRRLRCTYLGGMTSTKYPNEGPWWGKLGLNFLAVQPFWVGESWQTSTVEIGTQPDTFAQFELELGQSSGLGQGVPVSIGGDAPSWPTIDLVGPAATATVTGPGLLISIPAGLAVGETAQIITDPRRRTAIFGGTEDWARVDALSTWQPLYPGDVDLDIVMTGASSASRATVSGETRYERPW